jgi:hypothetical protein
MIGAIAGHFVGILFWGLVNSTSNSSLESVSAMYSTIVWIVLIEITLFCGILSVAYAVLFSARVFIIYFGNVYGIIILVPDYAVNYFRCLHRFR